MTIVKHELKQNQKTFLIWTIAVSLLLMICILIFPEMKNEMSSIGTLFSSMGSFTQAFGMDRLNFGSLIGFYAIECGNVLGLGGALYACLIATSALSKEQKDRTAEFLFTHPISRFRIINEKLISVVIQILAMNLIYFAVALVSMLVIGEDIPYKEVFLMHFSFLLLQLELAGICFAISAFLKRSGMGLGLGIAILMYFLHLISNMTESMKFLKYISPYSYCDGADIVANQKLDFVYIGLGILYAILALVVGYRYFLKKDIS